MICMINLYAFGYSCKFSLEMANFCKTVCLFEFKEKVLKQWRGFLSLTDLKNSKMIVLAVDND